MYFRLNDIHDEYLRSWINKFQLVCNITIAILNFDEKTNGHLLMLCCIFVDYFQLPSFSITKQTF